jgi:hypothetical protein
MSGVETENERLLRLEARAVGAGLAGGIVAGVGMGLVLQFGTELLPVLGAFLGETSVLRGWLVHLAIGALYGILFAVVLAYPAIQDFTEFFETPEYVFAGITYTVMMAAVTIGILPFVFELPWTGTASDGASPNIPGPAVAGLLPATMFAIAHVVYGAILGAVYAAVGGTPD